MKSPKAILALGLVVAACGSSEPGSSHIVASAGSLSTRVTLAPGSAVMNDEYIDITGAATDGRSLRSAAFSIDGVQKSLLSAPTFVYRWQPTPADAIGSHTLVVSVTDADGNMASARQTLTLLSRTCNAFANGTTVLHGQAWGSLAQGQALTVDGACSANNP